MRKKKLFFLVLLFSLFFWLGYGISGTSPTFTLSLLTPFPIYIAPSGTANFRVTITPKYGFNGTVAFELVDAFGHPASGFTLSPSSLTISGTSPVTQLMTLSANSTTPVGTYILRVKATGGSVRRVSGNFTVRVTTQPAFNIRQDDYAEQIRVQRNMPENQSWTDISLTVTPVNGFNGTIMLSLEDPDTRVPMPGLWLEPNNVTVTGSNPQWFRVYVRANNGLIPSKGGGKGYKVRLKATSGRLVQRHALPPVDVWTVVGWANLNAQRVAYGNGLFVVAGHNGYDSHSRIYVYNPQNGNFTLVYDPDPYSVCGFLEDVTYDPINNVWVAAGWSAHIVRSTNGTAQSWEVVYGRRDSNGTCPPDRYIHKIRFVNNRIMAWNYGQNIVWYSFDGGLSWNDTHIPIPTGYSGLGVKGLTYGKGKFVAVADGSYSLPNFVAISTDGLTWATYLLNVPETPWGKPRVEDILYVPDWDKFVLVGSAGLVGISDDGLSWNFQFVSGGGGNLSGLAYGNGVLVAGSGSFPVVAVTSDGRNWRVIGTNVGTDARSVAFGNGTFAATGAGNLAVSP
jgi:hypothetical protein